MTYGLQPDGTLRVRPPWNPESEVRDVFAAAAMTGLLAHGDGIDMEYAEIAETAFRVADAMLAERAK